MKLTNEEIEGIAEQFVEWLGDTPGQRERGLPLDLVPGFARAIEAAVFAKKAPKFKVGDRIRIRGDSNIRTIISLKPCSALVTQGDNHRLDVWTIDLELVEEEA